MNKTAIKNFAIWARNKLIADISYRAGLMGITADGIQKALPQSTGTTEFYDIGTAEPYSISGDAIKQRKHLVELIRRKEKETNYKAAYKYVLEEVAYTWFNRLIAVRFMEVNDYLPSHIRVLSSDSGKMEPDLVTTPFDAKLAFSRDEEQTIYQLKQENKIDEVFRILFIKQCNALNEILPALFEKTSDYTELLLNLSVIDQEGVVYHLVHDIPEEDFDVERGGQVEIIGWLYQYYNTEPKNEAFAKSGKISKEEIPAVTQLFTPDWIVRYMVENSVGRLWIEHLRALDESADEAALASNFGWKYYLPEAEQEPEVEAKLHELRKERASLTLEQITMIDPCMGSGHILVYAFDVLMQIYENAGYGQRDAARSILKNNLFGLDIDDRAYQMAYFAVMMKAREYNRRILNGENNCKVYSIQESNGISDAAIDDMGGNLSTDERRLALKEIKVLVKEFKDAKEYGSILNVGKHDWDLLRRFAVPNVQLGQLTLDMNGVESAAERMQEIIDVAELLADRYLATITNPPYLGGRNQDSGLLNYIVKYYEAGKADLYSAFIILCGSLTKNNGYRAMITQHSWMFLSSFEKLRRLELNHEIISMLHLGPRAFDEIGGEVVQTTTWISSRFNIKGFNGIYHRLIDFSSEKEKESAYLKRQGEYVSSKDKYFDFPGIPVAYWFNHPEVFKNGKALEIVANPRQGLKTLDNDYYLKLWFEVAIGDTCFDASGLENAKESNKKWFPINHGGDFKQYYGNNCYVVNWENDGQEMKAFAVKKYNSITRTITNIAYYFQPGITWSVLCSEPSFRKYGKGFIFSNGGQCIVPDDPYVNLDYLTGFLNSNVAGYILNILSPTLGFESGYVKKLPILFGEDVINDRATSLAKQNIEISKEDWDSFEISWDFRRHPLIASNKDEDYSLRKLYASWIQACKYRFETMKSNKQALNELYMGIYHLENELDSEVSDKEISLYRGNLQKDIKSLLSYAVGCMFGRYSVDKDGLIFAGGDWDATKYESFVPDADNIIPITDEEYLEDDIISRLSTWLKVVYGDTTLEENLDFIAEALGNRGTSSRDTIRSYFLNDFFKDHSSMYSFASSGKRPIYWLFDSGKQNGFKALIYLHRYNADTIGNLRVDYLHRMQRIYEGEISRMQDMIDHSTSAREVAQATKRREKLLKQLKECHEYDEKLAHLALSRIELNLDDGVKKNYRKIQTASDGKFYEVLADSKNIMSKE